MFINPYFSALFIILSIALISSGFTLIYFTTIYPDINGYLAQYFKAENREKASRTAFQLKDISEANIVTINDNDPGVGQNKLYDSCTHYNCFDVYRCSSEQELIKVYIYPVKQYVDKNGALISNPFSDEYWQLLDAVHTSDYFTNNPDDACVYIPSIDLLSQHYLRPEETSQVLASLTHWNEDGSNHLLFNMLPGSFPDYNRRLDVNSAKAILAGGGFDSWTYRPTLDVSIPVYSPFSESYGRNHSLELVKEEREWLVVSVQYNLVDSKTRSHLDQLDEEYSSDFLLLGTQCSGSASSNVRCSKNQRVQYQYPEVLGNATFCLLLRTAYLAQPSLSDALMLGCIPVVAVDDYILPFESKIDWKRVSIRIHEHSLGNIISILKSIPKMRVQQMREQSFHVWKRYFSSMKTIALATLRILNERLFPQIVTSIEEWNKPVAEDLYKPLSLISPKLSARLPQGFTAVILTYDRFESLYEVILRVVQATSCAKVLVIWNHQEKKPPPVERWPKVHVPLKILIAEGNRLSNRFYPYSDIETESILAIDDDIVMLTADELEFGFQVWKEFPDRIVGFPSRVHRWDSGSGKWKYESEWTNNVSMVLTGAAFYHKYYNYLYSFEMPAEIKEWVDDKMNCEDIAMNFLVANVTGKAPIKVTPRKKFKCPECTSADTLSADVIRHLTARSECINKFASIYGRMPVKAVEFRADPVLYKDNLPEKLKKFNHIGSL